MNIIENPLYQKLLLTAVAIGVIMDGLDGSIVNVVLPVIAADFGTDTGTIAWVVITYLLMMAGFLLVFGKLADRGHIRKIFLGGFVIFTAGSAACGLSPDLYCLLGARMFQGIGAAMIAAAAPMLCVKCLPARMLGLALGVLTMASSIGFAAGPALGGILTHYLSWHWIFLINVPIGIAAVPFALRVIPKDGTTEKKPFDLTGAALLFGMMTFGIYALERLPHLGVSNPQILACTVLCIVFAVLFVFRELRTPTPLINIRVFAAWQFSAVVIAFLIINVVRDLSADTSRVNRSPRDSDRQMVGSYGTPEFFDRRLRGPGAVQSDLCSDSAGDGDCPAALCPGADGYSLGSCRRTCGKQDCRDCAGGGAGNRFVPDGGLYLSRECHRNGTVCNDLYVCNIT